MKLLVILAAVIGLQSSAFGQSVIFSEPLSPRIANYTIAATLDAKKKALNATETLVWKNTSADKVSELQFHLYLNAFKNSQSTFMKESGGESRGISAENDGRGWIDVTSMRVREGEDLSGKMEFIHPDDDNANDQTVVRVPLSRPVLPGATITIDLSFEAKIPKVFARTGYSQNYFLIGQWFPKVGVYEPAGTRYATSGRWNTHQFHSNTEFYADYGVYDVRMTVPSNFVLGATGVLQSRVENGNGTATHYYHAEDVHDFCWTTSPLFHVVEDQWEHVKIRLLIQPDRVASQSHRYLKAVKGTLAYFDRWMGKYPYPNLTVVDPQYGAMGSGGMEYPTFITGGSMWNLPEGLRITEGVTEHEFGHQYFYGLLASNEFEEAWLDEGFNQYAEGRIMDELYGVKTATIDMLGFRIGDFEYSRDGYVGSKNPKLAPSFVNAWQYKAGGYGAFTYEKTAVWMTTLERMIGRPVMDEVMRTYFERWKFKHPCATDFIAIVNEVVRARHGEKFGPDMNWYFDQVLYGTNTCDYEISSLAVQPISSPKGIFDKEGKKISATDEPKASKSSEFESRVVVGRLGEVQLPVDVFVKFDDGSEERTEWNGKERYTILKFVKHAKVVWAKVDPDFKIAMDVNTLNNSRSFSADRAPVWKYTLKYMFWVQNVLATAMAF